MRSLLDTPKHLDLIYDVGLHKGEDAEFYLRKGFRVVGFEADPDLAKSCRQSLKSFVDNGQLTIIEGAIVTPELIKAGQTKVRFYKNDSTSVWGTVHAELARQKNALFGAESRAIEVDVVDFAEAMSEHGVPYFLKIDIEGSEAVCINALSGFQARPSYISFEADQTSFRETRNQIDLLIKLGYTAFRAIDQSEIYRLQSPPYPAREGRYVAHCFGPDSSGLFGLEIDGPWKSRAEILKQYAIIRLSDILDPGLMGRRGLRSFPRFRKWTSRMIRFFTKAPVAVWYDTHARHSSSPANAEVQNRK